MGIVNQAAKRGSSPPAVGIRAAAPLVAGVVLLDWITKWAITVSMDHGAAEAVLPGFFNLVHVRNTGIAFSLFCRFRPVDPQSSCCPPSPRPRSSSASP